MNPSNNLDTMLSAQRMSASLGRSPMACCHVGRGAAAASRVAVVKSAHTTVRGIAVLSLRQSEPRQGVQAVLGTQTLRKYGLVVIVLV